MITEIKYAADAAMLSNNKKSDSTSTSNPYKTILSITGLNEVTVTYTPSFESTRFKIKKLDSNTGSEDRKAFEARFPLPEGIKWEGEYFGVTTQEGDVLHGLNLAAANRWRGLLEGWQARADIAVLIPIELLEKIVDTPIDGEDSSYERERNVNELRALLGKEGE